MERLDTPRDNSLRAALADRDVPCSRCGYNLRGCTRGECPECGFGFNLGSLQRAHEPRWSAWERIDRNGYGVVAPNGLFALATLLLLPDEARRLAVSPHVFYLVLSVLFVLPRQVRQIIEESLLEDQSSVHLRRWDWLLTVVHLSVVLWWMWVL